MKSTLLESVLMIINTSGKDMNLTMDDLDSNLIELGMNSIAFIQMIVALEDEFGCEIPDSKLLISEMDTVNKILEVLQSLPDVDVGSRE